MRSRSRLHSEPAEQTSPQECCCDAAESLPLALRGGETVRLQSELIHLLMEPRQASGRWSAVETKCLGAGSKARPTLPGSDPDPTCSQKTFGFLPRLEASFRAHRRPDSSSPPEGIYCRASSRAGCPNPGASGPRRRGSLTRGQKTGRPRGPRSPRPSVLRPGIEGGLTPSGHDEEEGASTSRPHPLCFRPRQEAGGRARRQAGPPGR